MSLSLLQKTMSISPKNTSPAGNAVALGLGLALAPFTGGYSLFYSAFHVAAANGIKAVQNASADKKGHSYN